MQRALTSAYLHGGCHANAAQFQALCVQPQVTLLEALRRLDSTVTWRAADGRRSGGSCCAQSQTATAPRQGAGLRDDALVGDLPAQVPQVVWREDADAAAVLRLMDEHWGSITFPCLIRRPAPHRRGVSSELTQHDGCFTRIWATKRPHL